MSLFGRALAGAGSAVSGLANKYIDEDLARQRAQVLADIQQQSMERADAYTNSADRRERLRTESGLDAASQATAARQAEIDRLNDPALRAARIGDLNDTEMTDAAIAQKNRTITGTAAATADSTALMERAKAKNSAHDVAPGGKVIIGEGENTNPTAAEINAQVLREGLKGQPKQQRVAALDAALKQSGDQLKELNKVLTEGVAQGTLNTRPDPKLAAKKRDDDPGSGDPAYDRYQTLLRNQRVLQVEAQRIQSMYLDETGAGRSGMTPTSDPLGLNKGTTTGPMALSDVVKKLESGDRRDTPSNIIQGKMLKTGESAQGEMQVLPSTAGDPGFGVTPARDGSPQELQRVGGDYINALVKRYNGDTAKALAAYNWGFAKVDAAIADRGDKWLSAAPDETKDYVRRGVAMAGSSGGGTPTGTAQAAAVPAPPPVNKPAVPAIEEDVAPQPLMARADAAGRRTPEARAQAETERKAASDRISAQFEADIANLKPLQLLRKYGDSFTRSGLTTDQLQRLKAIERTV